MLTNLARPTLAVLLALSLGTACGGDEEPAPAPAVASPPPAPAPAAPAYSVGQIVEVQWGGTWYISRIERANADGTFNVHYGGWGSGSDSDQGTNNIRPAPANGAALFAQAENPGTPIAAGTQLAGSQAVWARWGGRWYEATVSRMNPDGQAHITYPNHDSSWDQDVAVQTLRLRN